MVSEAVRELRAHNLLIPIENANPEQWKDSYYQPRGERTHNAVDIMAPRDTPIYAVEDGTIDRMMWNAKGGNTIYQRDPSGRFLYYYAHLQRYQEGVKAGDFVRRGQLIGYVGTTGNAPPNAPHLHFSIEIVSGANKYSGVPLNPYEVFSTVPFAPDRKMVLRSLAADRRSGTLSLKNSASAGGPGYRTGKTSTPSGYFPDVNPAITRLPESYSPKSALSRANPQELGLPNSRFVGREQRNPVVGDDFWSSRRKVSSIGLACGSRSVRNWINHKTRKWLGLGLPNNSLLK